MAFDYSEYGGVLVARQDKILTITLNSPETLNAFTGPMHTSMSRIWDDVNHDPDVHVELISATTTKTGLTVRCELDTGQYPSGIVVSDAEMAAINIKRAEFHGEWNYTISPNNHPPNHALIS